MNKPLRADHLSYKTIGEETIILDSKIGKEVHQLNEVASFVWNLCDGQHDLQNIVNLVCEEFDVESKTATEDVGLLINELLSKSLITESAL